MSPPHAEVSHCVEHAGDTCSACWLTERQSMLAPAGHHSAGYTAEHTLQHLRNTVKAGSKSRTTLRTTYQQHVP